MDFFYSGNQQLDVIRDEFRVRDIVFFHSVCDFVADAHAHVLHVDMVLEGID